MIEENNDWIIFYSVINKHANKQGVKTETLCYINGSVNSLHKFINNEQYKSKQQTHVTDLFGSFVIPMKLNIQIQLGYIELLIYRSIYLGPLDIDIYRFYCI